MENTKAISVRTATHDINISDAARRLASSLFPSRVALIESVKFNREIGDDQIFMVTFRYFAQQYSEIVYILVGDGVRALMNNDTYNFEFLAVNS